MTKRRVLSLNPTSNASRAAAHRAMAKAALYSDSSGSVRMNRYNNHMEKARELEALAKLEGVRDNEP